MSVKLRGGRRGGSRVGPNQRRHSRPSRPNFSVYAMPCARCKANTRDGRLPPACKGVTWPNWRALRGLGDATRHACARGGSRCTGPGPRLRACRRRRPAADALQSRLASSNAVLRQPRLQPGPLGPKPLILRRVGLLVHPIARTITPLQACCIGRWQAPRRCGCEAEPFQAASWPITHPPYFHPSPTCTPSHTVEMADRC